MGTQCRANATLRSRHDVAAAWEAKIIFKCFFNKNARTKVKQETSSTSFAVAEWAFIARMTQEAAKK